MSDPLRSFDGIAQIAQQPACAMITLRGDLSDAGLARAVEQVSGHPVPAPLTIAGQSVAWMSPDELLLMGAYEAAGQMAATLSAALSGQHALAVDVSDARALFSVSGPAARDVMAKLCPLDVAPQALQPGTFRRTRIAQVPAAVWMTGADSFNVICFRSVSDYVWGLLCAAAMPGSEVGLYTAER